MLALCERHRRSGVGVEVERVPTKAGATVLVCSGAKSKCKGEVISPRNGQNVFLS